MKNGEVEKSTKPESVAHFDYHSYLLRIWPARNRAGFVWRASLENVSTGEMIGFESIADLCGYFMKEFGKDPPGDKRVLPL